MTFFCWTACIEFDITMVNEMIDYMNSKK